MSPLQQITVWLRLIPKGYACSAKNKWLRNASGQKGGEYGNRCSVLNR